MARARLGTIKTSLLWLGLALSSLTGGAVAAAKKDKPEIGETGFDSLPSNLFYFDDSDVVLVTDVLPGIVYRSTDAGQNWKAVKDLTKGAILGVSANPYNNKVAVAVGIEKEHWITKDQGETWKSFKTKYPAVMTRPPLSFHASDPDRIIFHVADCLMELLDCEEKAYYTLDGFGSLNILHDKAISCLWAKSTDLFTTGDETLDKNQVLCVTEGRYSIWQKDYRLLMSSDFFDKHEVEPDLLDGRAVPGVINVAAVKKYIAVAAKSEGTTELAMYITDDTVTWHRAEFGDHKLEEDAYTLLESTNYSIQVDVMNSKPTSAMGVLFTSNSNGTYFTKSIEHTNRNFRGYVDFEKIQNIQGIVLVNTVDNYDEVDKSWQADRKLRTSISFDDGRTWQPLKVDKHDLHLHSVTDQRNYGRIYSSPAPGIVLGVGNTGKSLGTWDEGDTYISDDAGVTWRKALSKPHLYEIGDQGAVLVAVADGETDQVRYSFNHGKNWDSVELEGKVKPMALLTVPDSTSLKFILVASKGGGDRLKYFTIAIDFSDMHERKCGSDDFEKWPARVDEDGKPSCIMGHKQFYRRRKANAECFVDEEFKDPQPEFEDCKCTDADYECDYNFIKSEDGKDCLPAGPLSAPADVCKSPDDEYEGSSGFRLIPGNTCIKKDGVVKDEPKKRPCKDTFKAPANGKITNEVSTFKADSVLEYYYLERKDSASGTDETIIMRTDRRETYITYDHGKTWEEAVDDEIVAIYPHQYINDRVYMITASKRVYYSENRGKAIHHFDAPEAPNQDRLQILSFHPHEPDWLLWTGGKDCSGFGTDCHSVAHVSTKHGEQWTTLLRYVRKCQWVAQEGRNAKEELVYCEQFKDEDTENPLQLVSSEDWFEHKTTYFEDVINFATMSEFIIVALRDEDQKSLRVDTSIDGQVFANAKFPKNFEVPHQQAYTVLDSSTHSIFLHVTVNNKPDQEYGSIVKSNSNGTSYVMSISNVNRNTPGYVDFEKMQGLEGVAIVNVVANVAEVDGGSKKKLKTMITHNDGAEWSLIDPPAKDSDGKGFDCKDAVLEHCSLHLHSYTERKDPRDTYSSPSAVGLMMGVGNVGPNLGQYKEGDTFITRDGGVTWHEVFKGTYMWEYGDQGSIIVIVQESAAVNSVYYTVDEGDNWTEYQFSESKMLVDDISTVPSDTSRNFLLWAHNDKGSLVTINLDFTGLTDKQCHLDDEDPEAADSDYYLWEPKHPLSDNNCLFGHISQYHRKKSDSKCYNGPMIERLHKVVENCTCTRQDFECDYNYERQNDASCALVPGEQPLDPQAQCAADPKLIEFYEPTGYRRIPLTTCAGGRELDVSTSHPCPGREPQYEQKHGGISGVRLFFAIVLPIAAAGGVGYWVWKNWEGKFGSIRLGDSYGGLSGGGPSFSTDAPWVKYPVAALSGFVAVLAAIPMVVGGIWRSVSGRFGRGGSSGGGFGGFGGRGGSGYTRPYTTRSSFQRGRGDYAIVDPDEGELLGDESEEEV
ncbi:hypothetical protein AAFC00_006147 [Neodothiora populina]|uniref:Vacuolar protein sorting/targeting protein 10 n=1 Tax=Neodothiora populina TaxID=2781224 RepID=A0ABR3P466_9PEZI